MDQSMNQRFPWSIRGRFRGCEHSLPSFKAQLYPIFWFLIDTTSDVCSKSPRSIFQIQSVLFLGDELAWISEDRGMSLRLKVCQSTLMMRGSLRTDSLQVASKWFDRSHVRVPGLHTFPQLYWELLAWKVNELSQFELPASNLTQKFLV
jgi:hypothetical protein